MIKDDCQGCYILEWNLKPRNYKANFIIQSWCIHIHQWRTITYTALSFSTSIYFTSTWSTLQLKSIRISFLCQSEFFRCIPSFSVLFIRQLLTWIDFVRDYSFKLPTGSWIPAKFLLFPLFGWKPMLLYLLCLAGAIGYLIFYSRKDGELAEKLAPDKTVS